MKKFVKTADGSVWEVVKEFPKRYLVKSRFTLFVYKRSIVAKFEREEKQHE